MRSEKTLGLLGLRRFAAPVRKEVIERCGFCSAPVAAEHSHVVDLEKRGILCVCRPCYLLFMNPGAAGGRFRAVPDRYSRAEGLQLTESQWDTFQIPVGMAFFFHNSSVGRTTAFYPSPAGATESALALDAWKDVAESLQPMEPDVEALLVRRKDGRFECFIVPIDACYELVGRIRQHWRGFHGGDEAWREIDAFFASVREKCEVAA